MSKNKTVRNVFFVVFYLFVCMGLAYAESCSTAGATQNKYTASGWSYSEWMPTSCVCASPNKWSSAEKACIKCGWSKEQELHNTRCPEGADTYELAMSGCEQFYKQFVSGEVSELGKTGVTIVKGCTVTQCESSPYGDTGRRYVWSTTFKTHTCAKIY